MKFERHLQVSSVAALAYYGATHSVSGGLCLWISGVLIDSDHWIEYWHDCGFDLNVRRLFQFCNSGTNSRFFIIFHSYEVIFILVFLLLLARQPIIAWSIFIGMGLHLIMDWWNIVTRFKYYAHSAIIFSFFYRLSRRFQRSLIDPELRRIIPHAG